MGRYRGEFQAENPEGEPPFYAHITELGGFLTSGPCELTEITRRFGERRLPGHRVQPRAADAAMGGHREGRARDEVTAVSGPEGEVAGRAPIARCQVPHLRDQRELPRSWIGDPDAFLHVSACSPIAGALGVGYLSTSETLAAVMARPSQRSKVARSVHASMCASSSWLGVSCRFASTRRREARVAVSRPSC